MIKYVATVKIKGTDLNRTIEATAYESDYMSDYDLYDADKELRKEIKKIYGDDIEIVSCDIRVCENGDSSMAQLGKVKEEFKELLDEVVKKDSFSYIKNRDTFIAEGLDLITATVNLLLLSGLSEQDFEKHINKLEYYKNTKYKNR